MNESRNEFLDTLCDLYMIVLLAVIPLYTGGTYFQIGDTKYLLFRNVSVICIGLWIFAGLFFMLIRHLKGTVKKASRGFSPMDAVMLLYAGSVLLSALGSAYQQTAWTGYRDWYMGAVSQCLFVGIYFFVSRHYRQQSPALYFGITAFFAVVVLGICQRLGWNVLGLLTNYNIGDWEYSHMISTLGNINWACGYFSIAIAIPVAGFLKEQRRLKSIFFYAISVSGLVLLSIQGSDSGVMIAVTCIVVCLLWGSRNRKIFCKALCIAAGVAFCLPVYGNLVLWRGEKAIYSLPSDGPGVNLFVWKGWWMAGVACMVLYVLLICLSKLPKRIATVIVVFVICLAASGLIVLAIWYVCRSHPGEEWGSGRSVLWRLAWQGFRKNDWMQKIFGVGPDCFAEYVYSSFPAGELPSGTGRWAGAVFANAHNEWLNHLVNLGVLGTGCYLAIFVCGICRYRKCLPVFLALVLYGANSLVSFQQVLSTPLLFLILGISESVMRKENQGMGQEVLFDRGGMEG